MLQTPQESGSAFRHKKSKLIRTILIVTLLSAFCVCQVMVLKNPLEITQDGVSISISRDDPVVKYLGARDEKPLNLQLGNDPVEHKFNEENNTAVNDFTHRLQTSDSNFSLNWKHFVRVKRDDGSKELEELATSTTLNNTTSMSDFNETFLSEEEHLEKIKDYIFPKTWTWILIVCHAIVFVIGLFGNALVCAAVYRNHSMRTVTNYFIVNLAIADFMVILFCLPPTVIWDVTMTWFFGVAMCKIVLYLQSVSVTVSVLTLTFISIDRWYAICFPLKFKSTTGRAKTAIWIIWMIALTCDIPEVIYATTNPTYTAIETIYFTQCEPNWSQETDTWFIIVKMVIAFYALPLLVMSFAYLQIIRVLWRSGDIPPTMRGGPTDGLNRASNNTFALNMNSSTEGQQRSRKKAAKMLFAVVSLFAFCYFPLHLLSTLRATVGLQNSEINRALSLISHWLCYANSAINPIVYNFMSGKFRKEFRSSLRICSKPDNLDGLGRTSTYIYRYTTNHNNSSRSRTEIIPLNNVRAKIRNE